MAATAAAMKCARCGATDHATAQCHLSFYKKDNVCPLCNKACKEVGGFKVCLVVKARQENEWKARQAVYQGQKEDNKFKKAVRLQEQKLRSGSDDASDGASTRAETMSLADVERLAEEYDARQTLKGDKMLQNARYADGKNSLSEADEREARKIEKKLRDIAILEEKLSRGCTLEKLQLEKIRLKDSLESTSVMLKIRAGALRLALAPTQAAPRTALAPVAKDLVPAVALPAHAKPENRESLVEMPTKPEGPTVNQMVATIRGELGLDDSLTTFQVLHEANLQLGITPTGTIAQQASFLYREITPA
jgi:hypothetical protein